MLRILWFTIFICIFCLPITVVSRGSLPAAWAQAIYSQHEVKAQLIERFTRFIRWPKSVWDKNPENPFVIGLIGDAPLAPYLEALGKETLIKGKPLLVIYLQDLKEINKCQLLFISGTEKKQLTKILNKTRDRPIVTVGDTEGFADKGVLINFYHHGSNIRFEINHAAVRASGLHFSSRLLRVAQIIDEGTN